MNRNFLMWSDDHEGPRVACIDDLGEAQKLTVVDEERYKLETSKGVFEISSYCVGSVSACMGFVSVLLPNPIDGMNSALYFDPRIIATMFDAKVGMGLGHEERTKYNAGDELKLYDWDTAWEVLKRKPYLGGWETETLCKQLIWVDADGKVLSVDDFRIPNLEQKLWKFFYVPVATKNELFGWGLKHVKDSRIRIFMQERFRFYHRNWQFATMTTDGEVPGCIGYLGEAKKLKLIGENLLELETDLGRYELVRAGHPAYDTYGILRVRVPKDDGTCLEALYFDPRVTAALIHANYMPVCANRRSYRIGKVFRLPTEEEAWRLLGRLPSYESWASDFICKTLTWIDAAGAPLTGEEFRIADYEYRLWKLFEAPFPCESVMPWYGLDGYLDERMRQFIRGRFEHYYHR